MITNPEDLKALSEKRIVKVKEGDEETPRTLSDKVKQKWHNTLYGEKK